MTVAEPMCSNRRLAIVEKKRKGCWLAGWSSLAGGGKGKTYSREGGLTVVRPETHGFRPSIENKRKLKIRKMMESLLWLIMLSAAMFAGSFIAGSIPLSFQMSEDKMRVMSTFSAGLMVGTALIVILPEGVETLYRLVWAF